MQRCFVIQPFDGGTFDKRYKQTFKPAIEKADLEPYRADNDPSVEVPIEAIEDGIRSAAICFADITTDNPNVWYELGYARASGRPVVMICSDERAGSKYPFDIQHRTVIRYETKAQGDFEDLKQALTEKLTALLAKGETLRQMAEEQQVAPVSGLTQQELSVLAVMAGSVAPGDVLSFHSIRNDAEKAGLTNVAVSLGIVRLKKKQFIVESQIQEGFGDPYSVFSVSESGWSWIEQNEKLFVLRKPSKQIDFVSPMTEITDGDIPF